MNRNIKMFFINEFLVNNLSYTSNIVDKKMISIKLHWVDQVVLVFKYCLIINDIKAKTLQSVTMSFLTSFKLSVFHLKNLLPCLPDHSWYRVTINRYKTLLNFNILKSIQKIGDSSRPPNLNVGFFLIQLKFNVSF